VKELRYLKEVLATLDGKCKKTAQQLIARNLTVDLFKLESLVNPDRFEFPEEEVEMVGVDLNEDE